MRTRTSFVGCCLGVLLVGAVSAQFSADGQQAAPKPPAPPASYPVRPPGDPKKIEHGKQTFSANCSFCHGSDARGGETGPNLVRSQIVLDDKTGELIGPIIKNGIPGRGMPPIGIDAEAIADVVEFLHSLENIQRGMSTSAPLNLLVGDAAAGETYFKANCSTCHSATGDLAGVGGRYPPRGLQDRVVSGRGAHVPPTTAVVTLPSGEKIEGKLMRRDAFFVSVMTADGSRRTFPLTGTKTKIEMHDPFQAHLDMLPQWKDSDIHNVTRYLSTLK